MRIVVIGAGAMGGLYGGRLKLAGEDVVLVDSARAIVDAIRQNGLKLGGVGGDQVVHLPATDDPEQAGEAFDLALIFTDTNATAAAAKLAKRLLKPAGFALTLQNGIGNVEALCAELGAARVVAGLSYHSGASSAPGVSMHTNRGPTWIGELDGKRTPRLEALTRAFAAAGLEPALVDNVMAHVWAKFVHNCAINPIAAVSGLRVGEIARNPAADALQSKVIEEILAVIAAKGVRLPDGDPTATIKAFCKRKFNRPSMQQHLEAGRRTEIDALNGALVRLGQELGVPTPYNQALVWLVKAREAHMRQALHGPPLDYAALEAEAAR